MSANHGAGRSQEKKSKPKSNLAAQYHRIGIKAVAAAANRRTKSSKSGDQNNKTAKRKIPVDDRTKTAQTLDQATNEAEHIMQRGQERYSVAMEGARDLNTKLVEMVRANADAAIEAANQITSAQNPADLAQAWSSYATKQFAMLSDQMKELVAAWQKLLVPPT